MANVERIVVKHRGNASWWVHQATNGHVWSTSEVYDSLAGAKRAAEDAHPHLPIVVEPPGPTEVDEG